MSDPVTSGDPSGASAATAGPAPTAATPGNSAPIGSFGTAKGSGLLRGKRPTPPAASAASSPAPSGYQPSTIEVIRPQSEYKNPFTGETSVPSPASPEPVERVVNEPSVPLSGTESRPLASSSPADVTEAPPPAKERASIQPAAMPAPVAATVSRSADSPAVSGELFPLELADTSRKSVPSAPAAKAELNILPTEEMKRPAVSWGDTSQNGESRGRRDERPTFRPERRDSRPVEPREPRPFEPREPRREPVGDRNAFPRDQSRDQPRDFRRDERPATAAAPVKKPGGFFSWLKSLFAGKPAQPEVRTGDRDDQGREGHGRDGQGRHNRRRHRGGRGRSGFQGDNRGPREQPRDPRDEPGPSSHEGSQSGEHRYEGGGRRRHRGGRGRNRDDRGGPRPEGQQGGGAI